MMAAPFVAFSVSIGLALAGRERSSRVALVAAITLSVVMFLMHATDSLPISL
jgi:hypothetical protein